MAVVLLFRGSSWPDPVYSGTLNSQSSSHFNLTFTMLILKLITLLLTSIDVQVDLLDGNAVSGSLTSIDAKALTLQVEGQPKTIPLTDVITVTSSSQKPEVSGDDQGQIILGDGSLIAGRLQSITARETNVRSAAAGHLNIPRLDVRAILLAPANPEWDEEWQAFLQRDNQDDLLILKKRDGTGLDFYGGVISAASADNVDFVLDGDTVPVPRTRIYGLIFAAQKTVAKGTTTLQLFDGSEINTQRLAMNADALKVETSWNQTLTISLAAIHNIDFSSGRFHYLSDLDPVKETYMGTHPKGSPLEELLKSDDVLGKEALKLWKLHRDKIPMGPFGPLPLTLKGKTYKKGVWLFPKCRIDYALDGQYSTFQTIAGVDDEVASNCSSPDNPSKVQLTILADGDEAWKQLIEAPADPVTINLDVSKIRTLSILVDFGDDDSACDFLDLADARLLVVP